MIAVASRFRESPYRHRHLLHDDRTPLPAGAACAAGRLLQERHQALPLQSLRVRSLRQVEQRWHDVDELNGLVDLRPFRHPARPPYEERHVHHLAVDALAVPHPAVVLELFAVIAQEVRSRYRARRPLLAAVRRAARARCRAPGSKSRTSPCRRPGKPPDRSPPSASPRAWPCPSRHARGDHLPQRVALGDVRVALGGSAHSAS